MRSILYLLFTSLIAITYASAQIAISSTINNPSCYASADGTIDLSVSGGTPPYVFVWGDGSSNQNRTKLDKGSYLVVVVDSNGDSATKTFMLSAPNQLVPSGTSTNPSCIAPNSGAINLSVTGGTPPYSFKWSTGATVSDLTNLSEGIYLYTITDANGCQLEGHITLVEESDLTLTVNKQNVSCFGEADGGAEVQVEGGTAPYSYSWSNGSTIPTINNMSAGNYTVTVTDYAGCSATTSVYINEPMFPLRAEPLVTSPSCSTNTEGAINLQVSGGTSPYSYQWNSGETTQDISGLLAGQYNYTVTDSKGCLVSGEVTIEDNNPLTITTNTQNVSCFGEADGWAEILVEGGEAPYTYIWDIGTISSRSSNLPAGNYSVRVTDNKGCTASTTVSITQPQTLEANSSINHVSCNGDNSGSISLSITGGTEPYVYSWNNGATTANLTSLTAGQYTYTVTDANSCTLNGSITITEPATLSVEVISQSLIYCSGDLGALQVVGQGGSPPYSYQWSEGTTTETVTNLGAGTYSVVVTDANSCSSSLSFTLTDKTPIILDTEITYDRESANFKGYSTATGGSPPYTYMWYKQLLDNKITLSTLSTVDELELGVYYLDVTDNYGCVATEQIIIDEALGVNNSISKLKLELYPNPSQGKLFVQGPDEVMDRIEGVYLYNTTGKLCQVVDKSSIENGTFDLSKNLSNGIYFIAIGYKASVYYQRIYLNR